MPPRAVLVRQSAATSEAFRRSYGAPRLDAERGSIVEQCSLTKQCSQQRTLFGSWDWIDMMLTQNSPTLVKRGARSKTWPWIAVMIVLAGEILDLLDSLVTTIAGPTIMRDLGGSQGFIQWLSAGYTIAMAAGLLIGGRLGDMFGRKRMFLLGMAGFTATSLVS